MRGSLQYLEKLQEVFLVQLSCDGKAAEMSK